MLLALALFAASAVSLAATGGAAPSTGSLPSAACHGAPARAGDVDLAIVSHGVRRTARVHVAPGALRGPAAVLMAFAGTGHNGPFMERYSGLAAQLDRGPAAIGVFPSADGMSWNAGELRGGPDDVDFVSDLIDAVSERWCVDLDRVTAAGVSNGGSMVALLACAMPQRLAGVAIVAGGFGTLPPCRSRRPVSVLEIHGRADQVVPYWGVPTARGRGAVVPWLSSWIARDRCRNAHPRVRAIAPARRPLRLGRLRRRHRRRAHRDRGRRAPVADGATPPDPARPRRSRPQRRSGRSSRRCGSLSRSSSQLCEGAAQDLHQSSRFGPERRVGGLTLARWSGTHRLQNCRGRQSGPGLRS